MTFSASQFDTASLREHPRGEAVARILAAAVNAVEPGEAIRRSVRRDGNKLLVRGEALDLSAYRRVVIISIGKAAAGMAAGLAEILGDRLDQGLIVAKHGARPPSDRFGVVRGGHPLPDRSSLLAGKRVLELAATLGRDDLLICLISGGGSALVTAPEEGLSLHDLQSLTRRLLASGASVDEINTLRRPLDRVKGGGLARAANDARLVTLIISDVVGNPLEAIASGPTVPNPTTHADALAVLEKYQLAEGVPAAILSILNRSDRTLSAPTTPGSAHIIASNLDALQAALVQAEAEGFHPYLLRADLQGEARDAGVELADALRWEARHGEPIPPPACLVAGGETTVTLHGKRPGGRNTELALAATIALADFPDVMLITLASDGEDGSTDAAGAVVTGATFRRARTLGLDPSGALNRNDSYRFFAALDDLLKPGPTGTNVNDVALLLAF